MGGQLGYPVPAEWQIIYYANCLLDAQSFEIVIWFGRSPLLIQSLRIIHAKKQDAVRVVHKISREHDPHARSR